MRIQFAGDIHCEFGGTPIRRSDLVGDVLVLAGDIHCTPSGLIDYIKRLHATIPIIYVLGNHEHHGGHWDRTLGIYQWRLEKEGFRNIFLLENDSIELNGVRFLGATLWSDCGEGEQGLDAESLVADFVRIDGPKTPKTPVIPTSKVTLPPEYVPSKAEKWAFLAHAEAASTARDTTLSWQALAERYAESMAWLEQELKKPYDGKTVVVTHFAPSLESNAPEYADSPIRKYYCNQLDDWIKNLGDQGPDLWIHGHTHYCVDYKIGKTRVVSNQRGYNEGDFVGFDPQRCVEVEATCK